MTTFQLNTTGAVVIDADDFLTSGNSTMLYWDDLSPFTQGYIEALFASVDGFARIDLDRPGQWAFKGFSDLAPETFARIIADCEAIQSSRYSWVNTRVGGAAWWHDRQAGRWNGLDLPPQTVQLGDDGKVRLV